jgi:hypothetical protein
MNRSRPTPNVFKRVITTFRKPPPQSLEFDEAYYLRQNPDVKELGVSALEHYLNHGWREGRRPNEWFDPTAYLERYLDVRIQGTEPLLHFISHGRNEGRLPDEVEHRDQGWSLKITTVPVTHDLHVLSREELASEFDEAYYTARNPDVLDAGVEPLDHFLSIGWKEGRNPSRTFDVTRYLEDNSDVKTAEINPFVHYINEGRAEGRPVSHPPSVAAERLRAATSAHLRARNWAQTGVPTRTLTASDILSAIEAGVGGSEGIVVAISHDDYDDSTGGVQLLIADERDATIAVGFQYLHVSPLTPLPILADGQDPRTFLVRVRLDHHKVGVVTVASLAEALRVLVAAGTELDMVIHHLMGHSPEAISALILAAEVNHPLMWIHDYFTLCSDYSLMRNDIEFCGAPPLSSLACSICCYGEERDTHARRMETFFETHSPIVLAPSAIALEIWQRGHLPCSASMVHSPARLSSQTGDVPRVGSGNQRLVRVAHLGASTYLKGWHVFEDLALERAGDARYEFLHFGTESATLSAKNVRHIEVSVSGQNPHAMVEALVREEVDVVISWQMWAETFSFTAHEALAAGAFVVARRDAGNVWPAVANHPPVQGLCLDSPRELNTLLAEDALHNALRRSERRYRALIHGGGAVDHLLRRRVLRRNGQSLLPYTQRDAS